MMGDMSKYKNLNFILFGKQCDPKEKHNVEIYIDNPRLVEL